MPTKKGQGLCNLKAGSGLILGSFRNVEEILGTGKFQRKLRTGCNYRQFSTTLGVRLGKV